MFDKNAELLKRIKYFTNKKNIFKIKKKMKKKPKKREKI